MENFLLSSIPLDELKAVLRECIKSELETSAPTQKINDPEEILTENEVRKILQVSKVTIKKWRDEKKIPFYRIGTRIRYKKSEVLSSLSTVKKYGRKD